MREEKLKTENHFKDEAYFDKTRFLVQTNKT